MPSTTRLSLVNVPVLSKQQISTFPAKGIRKGSVQNTPEKKNSWDVNKGILRSIPNFHTVSTRYRILSVS